MGPLTSIRKSRTKGACNAQSARKMRQINPYTSDSLTASMCVKVCVRVCVCAAMCIAPIRGTIRIGLSAVPKLLVQVFNDFFKGHKVSILPENISTILSKFVAQVQEFYSIPSRQLVGFAANSFQLFTFTPQSCQFFKCFKYFLYIYFLRVFLKSKMNVDSGCVVAMCGANCVAIGTDHRFASKTGQTISHDFKKVSHIAPHLLYGMTGLQADILSVRNRMAFRKNIVEINEDHIIGPQEFTNLLSTFMFEHRFAPYYVNAIIAGLEFENCEPYICSLDSAGYVNRAKDFVVAGNCNAQIYGMCETLWEPNMEPNQLFEIISQSMVHALDRDAVSGWGATVYVIEEDKLTERTLKTRMD